MSGQQAIRLVYRLFLLLACASFFLPWFTFEIGSNINGGAGSNFSEMFSGLGSGSISGSGSFSAHYSGMYNLGGWLVLLGSIGGIIFSFIGPLIFGRATKPLIIIVSVCITVFALVGWATTTGQLGGSGFNGGFNTEVNTAFGGASLKASSHIGVGLGFYLALISGIACTLFGMVGNWDDRSLKTARRPTNRAADNGGQYEAERPDDVAEKKRNRSAGSAKERCMPLVHCKECGHQLSATAKFCPTCGAPVKAAMNGYNCENCGLDLPVNTYKFCPECGYMLSDGESEMPVDVMEHDGGHKPSETIDGSNEISLDRTKGVAAGAVRRSVVPSQFPIIEGKENLGLSGYQKSPLFKSPLFITYIAGLLLIGVVVLIIGMYSGRVDNNGRLNIRSNVNFPNVGLQADATASIPQVNLPQVNLPNMNSQTDTEANLREQFYALTRQVDKARLEKDAEVINTISLSIASGELKCNIDTALTAMCDAGAKAKTDACFEMLSHDEIIAIIKAQCDPSKIKEIIGDAKLKQWWERYSAIYDAQFETIMQQYKNDRSN